jgi:hypothetical protein
LTTQTQALTALQAVRDLHRRETRWQPSPDADYSYDSEEECREFMDDLADQPYTFDICAECGRVEGSNRDDFGYDASVWPCLTRRVMGETDE